jgi:hypothetical protein
VAETIFGALVARASASLFVMVRIKAVHLYRSSTARTLIRRSSFAAVKPAITNRCVTAATPSRFKALSVWNHHINHSAGHLDGCDDNGCGNDNNGIRYGNDGATTTKNNGHEDGYFQ